MKKVLIFDLDGTLLNTVEDLTDSMNAALVACGFPKRTLSECQSFIGNGVDVFATKAIPEALRTRENIQRVYTQMESEYLKRYNGKTFVYEGMMEVLLAFQDAKISMNVFSNKLDDMSKRMVKEYFSSVHFSFVLGSSRERQKKPHPEGALFIAKELKISPSECLFIGDSPVDIETARNAGMRSVAVAWGFRTEETLLKANPDHLVKTPEELKRLILRCDCESRD